MEYKIYLIGCFSRYTGRTYYLRNDKTNWCTELTLGLKFDNLEEAEEELFTQKILDDTNRTYFLITL